MAFYRKSAYIKNDVTTVYTSCSTASYNHPQGEQVLIREWKNRGLAILHRFESSEDILPAFPEGSRILSEYGRADRDFSAKAWIYER